MATDKKKPAQKPAKPTVPAKASINALVGVNRKKRPSAKVTTIHPRGQFVGNETKRTLGGIRIGDLLSIVGAAVAAFALAFVFANQIAPITGGLAFFILWYVLFVALYSLIVSIDDTKTFVVDRVIAVVVTSVAVLLFSVLAFVIVFVIGRGSEALPYLNFYTQDMEKAGPLDPLTDGGVIHAIAGTLIQITIALAITIPLGIAAAVYLNEIPGRFSRFVRTIVEAMTALPSIVAGLFIFATAILMFGVPKSGFAASLAISVMMLPIMIRSADVVLRLVPQTLKEASIGLGASQWKTVWNVVLPTSRSGLTTSIILATARGVGETSPVLLTSGFTAALNVNPLDSPMVSLPLAIFQFVKSPEPTMIARGFGTAAVLMVLVLTLFVIARIIGGMTPEKSARARIRRAEFIARLARAPRSLSATVRRLIPNAKERS
jgi:phosphate transport system permease protein